MWPDCSYYPIAAVVDWPQPADIVVDFVAGNDAVRPIVQAMVDRGQVERAAVDHCSIVADLVAVDIDRDIDRCCWAIHLKIEKCRFNIFSHNSVRYSDY